MYTVVRYDPSMAGGDVNPTERNDPGAVPEAVAIAWGMVDAPQRGPARGMSHEQIVEAAVEIADAEGLAAVTMQRVAESLGFTTMALYRYVSGKDQLVTLMCDAAILIPNDWEIDPTDWRLGLRQWAEMVRYVYRAHPWVLEVPRTMTQVLMPNNMRVADAGLRALSNLGIGDAERIAVILVLSAYVASFSMLERDLATEEPWWMSAAAERLLSAISAEDLPYMAPLMAGGMLGGGDPAGSSDIEFEFGFGLDRLIDGLATLETD